MARVVKGWKIKAGFEDIGLMFHRLKLEWAGHLARLRNYRPDSWTVRTLLWRNRKHLEAIMFRVELSSLEVKLSFLGNCIRILTFPCILVIILAGTGPLKSGSIWHIKMANRKPVGVPPQK